MVNPQKFSESVMASDQQEPGSVSSGGPGTAISPAESARYTADMLESLRRIASQHGHGVLAHLLELAQAEARMLIRASGESRV